MSKDLLTAFVVDVFAARESLVPSAPLEVSLELDTVRFHRGPSETFAVQVALSFSLDGEDGDGGLAWLDAELRLEYRGEAPTERAAQLDFARAAALPDVWPFWLSWLHSQLAFMRLPVTRLPAALPPKLLEKLDDAYERGLRADADEAEASN